MTCHTISPNDSPGPALVPARTTAPIPVDEDLLATLAQGVARMEARQLFPEYERAAHLYVLMAESGLDSVTLPDGRVVRRRATCVRRTDYSIEIENTDGSNSIYEAGFEEEPVSCN